MTDKVQEIKEQANTDISELRMAQEQGILTEFGRGKLEALEEMVDFIDSLQKEPIFKVGDTIQKKDDNSIRYFIINKTSDGYRALRGLSDTIVIWFSEQDQWELVEEPASRTPADIEAAMQEVEEKSKAFTDAHQGESTDTILAQMRGEELVSEDLEEASKEWLKPQLDKSYSSYGENEMMELTRFDGYAMLDAIEFGAQWKEQQLMKNAVECEYFDGSLFCNDLREKYRDCDKVKVIIVKSE
jgi:hypothetical protein